KVAGVSSTGGRLRAGRGAGREAAAHHVHPAAHIHPATRSARLRCPLDAPFGEESPMRTLLMLILLLILVGLLLVYFGVITVRGDDSNVLLQRHDVELGTSVRNVEVPVVRMENRQVAVPSLDVDNAPADANRQ